LRRVLQRHRVGGGQKHLFQEDSAFANVDESQVDAGSSIVVKYSPLGEKLMTITVGEQAETGNAFNGTTDIAFAPNGRQFITAGYGNARVLE
jgi:hypothetical protein